MTDAAAATTTTRAEPDQISDRFFRATMLTLIIGALLSLAVFALVAWHGSLHDSSTTRPAVSTP